MITVYDNFPGPDGALIGTNAVTGQAWVATIAPYDDLAIVSHQAEGTVNDQNGAQVDGALNVNTYSGPWWIRIVVLLGAKAATTKSIGAWIGDDDVGPYFGLAVLYGGAQSAGSPLIDAGQIDASPSSVVATGVDPLALNEFVMQLDTDTATMRVYLNDDLLLTATGVTVDPATTPPFVISPACGIGTTPAAFSEVELGRGVYPIG